MEIGNEIISLNKKVDILRKEFEEIKRKKQKETIDFIKKLRFTNDLFFLKDVLMQKDPLGNYQHDGKTIFYNQNINEEIFLIILETRRLTPSNIDSILSHKIINNKLIRIFLDKVDFKQEILLSIPRISEKILSKEEKKSIFNDYFDYLLDRYKYDEINDDPFNNENIDKV